MIPSLAAVQQAHRLVDLSCDGVIDQEARNLRTQVTTNPMRVVELVFALADMAAVSRPPAIPRDEDGYQRYLKRAHAAHARGERLEWVVAGEREYQRVKKQRLREDK